MTDTLNAHSRDYRSLNALLNFVDEDDNYDLEADKDAVYEYFLQEVNPNTVFFHTLREKVDYLIENGYYEQELFDKYSFNQVRDLFKRAYSKKFRFQSLLGAYKYYRSYTLKTFDGKRYLERFEDRVSIVALYLAKGDFELATKILDEIMAGRFQPATPTFLNAGKAQRGELVSCFLLRTEDSMESISRAINASLQLSKRGGGVALNLSNLREMGAPIKKVEGQSSGVIPVMKLLEDAFSYANQLGARKGSGAAYLHIHHPDIRRFLDTRRENADEKTRIKTLSIGVVIPDITFELIRKGEDMYLFSPYDVEREYGRAFTEVDITKEYYSMVENPNIRKVRDNPRKLLALIAEVQFESGYPYLMFEGNVNRENPIDGRITMSNLCSEILQVSEPSTYNEDLSYDNVGKDISCNLGSMNIANAMNSDNFAQTVETAIRSLTTVSELSNITSVPSIEKGNQESHAIGLGQMNLHGYIGAQEIHYDSKEAVDFTNIYFYTVLYHAIRSSNKIARERGQSFVGFDRSDYASGEYFKKYIDKDWSNPETLKVQQLFADAGVDIPTPVDWKKLSDDVQDYGMFHQNLLATPPTASISYINHSTSSILPIAKRIETRKEGKIGRMYYAAPGMTNENKEYFIDAFDVGPEAIIRVYQAATQHVDQGLSCTLFFYTDSSSTDLIKSYVDAWSSGLKTLYYARFRQNALEGTEVEFRKTAKDPVVEKVEQRPAPIHEISDESSEDEECEACML